MKTNVVPNMAFRPYSLPPTMQQLGYTMKLGDEKRSGCERDWETTYDETINLTVRQPSAKKSALSASKLPFYSTGFVLTDTQRHAVEKFREHIFLEWEFKELPPECTAADKAKAAASVFHAADEARLGVLRREQFVECLTSLGISFSTHDLNCLIGKFIVERIASIKAVDYIEFICRILPESYNKLTPKEEVLL
uniref:EF-hand domain-containing protein n=1 Tax=Tetraselmis chuii TaxID=63592 RepID=A0A7S1SX95_9CHLO|mmetsp:Transcript_3045/g.5528  ORF Transcript_3045/g.5528 Transcript_3045/m.5528 type:complete len:194 (+) Transcript_3045:194-775(+)